MDGDPGQGSPPMETEQVIEQPMDTTSPENSSSDSSEVNIATQSPEPDVRQTRSRTGKRKHASNAREDERNVRSKVHDVNFTVAEPASTNSPDIMSDNGATPQASNEQTVAMTTSSSSTSGSVDGEAGCGQSASGETPTSTAAGGFQLDRESLVFAAECHMAVLQDEDGDTPLHLAVVQANKHLVHHLVYLISRSSRHVDIANTLRQTPLHLAAITGQADLIRLLLANNASCNMPDRLGRTGLHLVAERNYADCCSALLEARDVQQEVRNFDGYTPVHTAVFNNSYAVLQKLFEAGASVNPRDGKSGRTPLHHAAEAGNIAMVQFLIGNYADIDATTYAGNTPLHSAAGRGHEHIVSVLVTAGADTRLQNTEGDVAADVARFRNAFRSPNQQASAVVSASSAAAPAPVAV